MPVTVRENALGEMWLKWLLVLEYLLQHSSFTLKKVARSRKKRGGVHLAAPQMRGYEIPSALCRGELPHCSLYISHCALPCSLRRMPPPSPPLRPQGVLHHGRSPFFIPLARAVFMTGRKTCSSSSLSCRSAQHGGGISPAPGYHRSAMASVTLRFAHRWRGCRGSNSFFVDNQGASPLSTLWRPSGTLILPRREPRGISSVTPAGRSSPWAQPILHSARKTCSSSSLSCRSA